MGERAAGFREGETGTKFRVTYATRERSETERASKTMSSATESVDTGAKTQANVELNGSHDAGAAKSAPVLPSRPVNAPWSAIVKSKPAHGGGNPAAPDDGPNDGKTSPGPAAASDAHGSAKASKVNDAKEKHGNDASDGAANPAETVRLEPAGAPAKKAWGTPARNDPITPPTWPTLVDAKDPSKKPAEPPPVPPGPPPGAEDKEKDGDVGSKKKGRAKKDAGADAKKDNSEIGRASCRERV